MAVPHRADYGNADSDPRLLRFFQFVFAVILGMAADVELGFFKCLAHQYQTGVLDISSDNFPVFAFGIAVATGILGLVLIFQDNIIDFKRRRLTLISALIVGALLGGYFFPFSCGQTP